MAKLGTLQTSLNTLSRTVVQSKLVSKGLNGKRYSELHFNFEQCIDNLEQFIKLGNHKEIQAKHK
ncbi:hypothetical protein EEL36_10535 [Muribaculaceae bacterium Isolate-043 (Harlan)]|nr:hypothetical protein EEL36_10535 [Muribaculaceae bacterium Isolate-043 (Harlan)]